MVHFLYNPRQTHLQRPPHGSLVRVHASQSEGRWFEPRSRQTFSKSCIKLKSAFFPTVFFVILFSLIYFCKEKRCFFSGMFPKIFYRFLFHLKKRVFGPKGHLSESETYDSLMKDILSNSINFSVF